MKVNWIFISQDLLQVGLVNKACAILLLLLLLPRVINRELLLSFLSHRWTVNSNIISAVENNLIVIIFDSSSFLFDYFLDDFATLRLHLIAGRPYKVYLSDYALYVIWCL